MEPTLTARLGLRLLAGLSAEVVRVAAAVAALVVTGLSVACWCPSGNVSDSVGRRVGLSHNNESMASSCSIGQSAESPSDSPAERVEMLERA